MKNLKSKLESLLADVMKENAALSSQINCNSSIRDINKICERKLVLEGKDNVLAEILVNDFGWDSNKLDAWANAIYDKALIR